MALTNVPSAEDALEELQRDARSRPSRDVPALLRAAFTLGRAYELQRAAHHAAAALEELAEPDKPSSLDDLGLVYPDWGQGGSREF